MLSLKFPAFQKDEIEIIGIIEAVATGIMYVSKTFLWNIFLNRALKKITGRYSQIKFGKLILAGKC